MLVRLINISSRSVFVKYSSKYNIFRDLYEIGSFGLEIKNISEDFAFNLQKVFLADKELCYVKVNGGTADLLALVTIAKLEEISKTIKSSINEELGLRISNVIHNYLNYENITLDYNGKTVGINNILIMGILNVTPDSFSDGGRYMDKDNAVARGLELFDEGADIVDIGGESTRPGAEAVSAAEELNRTIPVIEEILARRPESIISIDTSKSEVAAKALECGCRIVNDISACTKDEKMFETAARYDAGLVLMHMKGNPQNMQDNPEYAEVVSEVYEFIFEQIEKAKKYNIRNILIDPGIGFGKRLIDNYELLERLEELKCLGCPIMIGVSRKSLLGKALNLEVGNREIATVITESLAIRNGARVIRTHNVSNVMQAKQIYKFISNPELVLSV